MPRGERFCRNADLRRAGPSAAGVTGAAARGGHDAGFSSGDTPATRAKKPGVEDAKDAAPGPRCRCGDWFAVEFRERLEAYGTEVRGSVPVMACPTCKNTVMPGSIARSVGKAAKAARAANQKTCKFAPKGQRFGLCADVGFEYCSADCEVIAGLSRAAGEAEGHRAPVFFDGDALLWYRLRGEYRVGVRGVHGRIAFPGGASLDYGVNRHGRVFCWLGDLDGIPQEEQERMGKHNVRSDHDVISGLYKALLGLDPENSAEERLKISLYELAEVSRAHAGLAIHGLEHADRRLAERLERPGAWRRDITQAVVNLVILCIETIDTKRLKGSLRRPSSEPRLNAPPPRLPAPKGSMRKPSDESKGRKALMILQSWIKANLHADEKSLMMPFFVLNDWRHYRVHRDGDGKLLKNLKAGRARLGMNEDDDDDERMYDLLIEGLARSCRALSAGIEEKWPARGQYRAPGAAAQDGAQATA